MKRLLQLGMLCAGLLCARSSQAAIAYVQSNKAFAIDSTETVVLTVTATNALVACIGAADTDSPALKTSTGWNSIRVKQSSSGHGGLSCWVNCNATGGSTTTGVTDGTNYSMLIVQEYSGLDHSSGTACLDTSGGGTKTGANPSQATAANLAGTTEQPIAAFLDWDTNKTMTAGTTGANGCASSGCTMPAASNEQDGVNGDAMSMEYKTTTTGLSTSSTATLGFTMTTGDTVQAIVFALKPAAAGGATTPTRSLMGVGTYGLPFGFFNPLPMLMGRDH